MHIGVVTGVQGDAAHADAVGEQQVSLGAVVAWVAVWLQQDAGGTGAGRAIGPRQAEMRAATIPPTAFIKACERKVKSPWLECSGDILLIIMW